MGWRGCVIYYSEYCALTEKCISPPHYMNITVSLLVAINSFAFITYRLVFIYARVNKRKNMIRSDLLSMPMDSYKLKNKQPINLSINQ